MLQLTQEEEEFITHHGIPHSVIFNVAGLKRKEYQELMELSETWIGIGATSCSKGMGHSIVSKPGHCLQCNTERIEHVRRHHEDGRIYVAVSQPNKLFKVGFTQQNITDREHKLNADLVAGIGDWKMIFHAQCKNAGKIERDIHSMLSDYRYKDGQYWQNRDVRTSIEVFRCGYSRIKNTISEIQSKNPTWFSNSWELPNAVNFFDYAE